MGAESPQKELLVKESTYNTNVQSTPNWIPNNVKDIDLYYIEPESGKTQVRQGGTDSTHVEQLTHSIVTFGQKVPVTVENSGTRHDGTTIYTIVDGNHRYATILKLRKNNPKDARWFNIKVIVRSFKNDFERLAYQSDANAHETPAKLSSISDAVVTLKDIILNGIDGAPPAVSKLAGSSQMNFSNPNKYKKELNAASKLLFPGMSARQRAKVIRDIQGRQLPGKFGRHTAGSVREDFLLWAKECLDGGEFLNGDFIHTVKNFNYIDWQLVARLFSARAEGGPSSSEDGNENVAIIYYNEVSNKTNSDLDDHRRKMVELLNRRNNSWFLKSVRGNSKKKVAIVDRIFIAPQKRESTCAETGFFEVPKNSKGEFSCTLIMTNGWDTTEDMVVDVANAA